MSDEIKELRKWVAESEKIVFFGGAGVSTESGIPDFRSKDGLYAIKYRYPPETILSGTFFIKNTSEFFKFYREKMIFPQAVPNPAHTALAKLEEIGRLKAVVTQNVDGLHGVAGSKNVIELHGSVHRNFCMDCRAFYPLEFVLSGGGIPVCSCGGIVKPDVTLFEEQLAPRVIDGAIRHISEADMLIVGGTSLAVFPAAALIDYYEGSRLVLINMSKTSKDYMANLVVTGKIGEVLPLVLPMERGDVSPEDE